MLLTIHWMIVESVFFISCQYYWEYLIDECGFGKTIHAGSAEKYHALPNTLAGLRVEDDAACKVEPDRDRFAGAHLGACRQAGG